MSSPHLGSDVTPFVDGELVAARAAQAREHLLACPECRRAVMQEQSARQRTQDSIRGVQASPELTARLLAMPAGPPSAAGSLDLGRSRRTPFVLGGSAALVGLFVLTLFVLGTPRASQSPGSLLAATDDADGAAATEPVGLVTDADLLDGAVSDWSVPSTLTVNRVDVVQDDDSQTLDVTLETAFGDVRLLERPGSLDEDATTAAATAVTVAGRLVYRVDGWYLLESGPCVVAVLGESDAAAESVIAELPEADGALDRIADGWQSLVG